MPRPITIYKTYSRRRQFKIRSNNMLKLNMKTILKALSSEIRINEIFTQLFIINLDTKFDLLNRYTDIKPVYWRQKPSRYVTWLVKTLLYHNFLVENWRFVSVFSYNFKVSVDFCGNKWNRKILFLHSPKVRGKVIRKFDISTYSRPLILSHPV